MQPGDKIEYKAEEKYLFSISCRTVDQSGNPTSWAVNILAHSPAEAFEAAISKNPIKVNDVIMVVWADHIDATTPTPLQN